MLTAALSACDTGDGKTLHEPTGTLPPTTVETTTTIVGDDGAAVLPSEPSTTVTNTALPTEATPAEFSLVGPWEPGQLIDVINTCDGADLSPALSWTEPPQGTTELVIAMVDESISNGPPFIHWIVAGISADDRSITEGSIPIGAIQGLNFFGDIGYGGPCPPPGDSPHQYRTTIYALNQQVELADGTPAAELLDFVQDVSVGSTDLVGIYER